MDLHRPLDYLSKVSLSFDRLFVGDRYGIRETSSKTERVSSLQQTALAVP